MYVPVLIQKPGIESIDESKEKFNSNSEKCYGLVTIMVEYQIWLSQGRRLVLGQANAKS